jgi:hypothetical protein
MLTPITPKLKATALELELERLDQDQASQHQDAINGDRDAIAMCLKIAELRADFLGTRAPASLRIDPVQLREQAQPVETTTERIRRALDEIAARKPREDPIAEESVRLIRGRTANGSPRMANWIRNQIRSIADYRHKSLSLSGILAPARLRDNIRITLRLVQRSE